MPDRISTRPSSIIQYVTTQKTRELMWVSTDNANDRMTQCSYIGLSEQSDSINKPYWMNSLLSYVHLWVKNVQIYKYTLQGTIAITEHRSTDMEDNLIWVNFGVHYFLLFHEDSHADDKQWIRGSVKRLPEMPIRNQSQVSSNSRINYLAILARYFHVSLIFFWSFHNLYLPVFIPLLRVHNYHRDEYLFVN